MPITDLTGTTWLLNSSVDVSLGEGFEIVFNSNSIIFDAFYIDDRGRLGYWNNQLGTLTVFDADYGTWESESYRTIEITGGTDATNSNLIAWLQQNATQQTAPTPSETKNIWANTNQIAKAFLGSSKVSKIYLGSTLVYERVQGTVLYTITTSITNNRKGY